MTTALITGISGQDGSYLAELLLAKGYQVHGLVRRSSEIARHRIDHLHHGDDSDRIELHYGDLDDPLGLVRIITEVEPDEIYHLAAQSHVAVSFALPDYTGSVSGLGTMRLLEAIRVSGVPARFYQASSLEMFGSRSPTTERAHTVSPTQPLRRRQGVQLLGDRQLSRGVRDVCQQRHSVQSRITPAWGELRDPQDHPRRCRHRRR